MPDGTDVGVSSSLDRAMAARGLSTADWQAQLERAAASWEAATGIRFVRVPDDGEPIRTPGGAQGDARFGDVRIAGSPQESPWLAGTFMPPPANLGTVAGDIILNTDQPWAIDGDGLEDAEAGDALDPTAVDLLTVALHEFGRDLGSANWPIPSRWGTASTTGASTR